jgi:hypothetical protein
MAFNMRSSLQQDVEVRERSPESLMFASRSFCERGSGVCPSSLQTSGLAHINVTESLSSRQHNRGEVFRRHLESTTRPEQGGLVRSAKLSARVDLVTGVRSRLKPFRCRCCQSGLRYTEIRALRVSDAWSRHSCCFHRSCSPNFYVSRQAAHT